MALSIKTLLKRARGTQPLNAVATTLVRVLAQDRRLRELARRHLPRVGVVETELPNGRTMRLWSRGDDGVANDVFWGGFAAYEPETSPVFWRLAQRARCTLDIGAHVGFYALVAALANPAAVVYAFEPLPQVSERLRRNVALNRVDNVECVSAAATDRDGEVDFFSLDMGSIPSSSSLSRSFMESSQRLYGRPLETTRVRALTLDRFVAERGIAHVDLVKLDIESAEPAALRGLRATLERDRPAILCEVLPGAAVEEIDAVLRPLGYRYWRLTPSGEVAMDAIVRPEAGCNYLCATAP